MTSLVVLEKVTRRYGDVTAVRGVDLEVREGEVLGILGPSGAGKSTLLRLVDLLEPADEGRVSVMGADSDPTSNDACEVRKKIGMVLQKPVVLNRSVANNLAYGLVIRGWGEDKIHAAVERELKKLGLEDRKTKNARTLSGGEMQRVSFSRSTIFSPTLLLLDEFAANLDPANVAMLEDLVKGFMEEDGSRGTILVTHNLFQAKRMCDRLALMWGGEMVEVADTKGLFESPKDERTARFVNGELVY